MPTICLDCPITFELNCATQFAGVISYGTWCSQMTMSMCLGFSWALRMAIYMKSRYATRGFAWIPSHANTELRIVARQNYMYGRWAVVVWVTKLYLCSWVPADKYACSI